MIMNGQGTDGFKKALRKDASIRCSIPSSKTLGLNLVIGSALKKSRCSATTMEGYGRHEILSISLCDLALGLGEQNCF
jgi:hypothetical protein